MALDLNKQYGPFPLKMWLIIGAGGIGIGLYVASKQNSGGLARSTLAQPPAVSFAKITIGNEQLPQPNGLQEQLTTLKGKYAALQQVELGQYASNVYFQNVLRQKAGQEPSKGTTFSDTSQDIFKRSGGITSTI